MQVKRIMTGGGMRAVKENITDMAAVMPAIAQAMLTSVHDCFRGQADPWGTPWRPLRPSTAANRLRGTQAGRKLLRGGRSAKQRKRLERSALSRSFKVVGALGSQRILKDTGMLAVSIHAYNEGLTAGVSTADVRAKTHQFGRPDNRFPNRAGAPLAPIPARPFFPLRPGGNLDLPAELHAEIMEMIRLGVMSGQSGQGGGEAALSAIELLPR